MRSILAMAFAVVFALRAAADEPTKFPYSAFVAVDAAAVRSGPGEVYYPVANLRRGDAVEVWRHDPDGWCAIRPPLGSFSWISAEFVSTADGRIGKIVGREVNVRVGTQFSTRRDAIQLRLNEGDEVEILADRMLTTGDRETRWFKISPPAGEFRWISSRLVVDHPSRLPPAGNDVAAGTPRDPFPAVDAASNDGVQLVSFDGEATATASLDDLEAALTQMVAVEPTAWHFEELERAGNQLVDRGATPIERSQARQFLGKIARFKDIQRRYGTIAATRSETSTVDRQLSSTAPAVPPKTALDGTTDPTRYDGVGRLSQVVLRETGVPGYALTNEIGATIAYLQAAPGVNLRQYVGLEVGVNGIRGTSVDAGKPQITAKRIDVLTRGTLQR